MPRIDPEKAFPDELLELRDKGVPLPVWYSGPYYDGNGAVEAQRQLDRLIQSATEQAVDFDRDVEAISAPLPADIGKDAD